MLNRVKLPNQIEMVEEIKKDHVIINIFLFTFIRSNKFIRYFIK
jgi:hypothetical protein